MVEIGELNHIVMFFSFHFFSIGDIPFVKKFLNKHFLRFSVYAN